SWPADEVCSSVPSGAADGNEAKPAWDGLEWNSLLPRGVVTPPPLVPSRGDSNVGESGADDADVTVVVVVVVAVMVVVVAGGVPPVMGEDGTEPFIVWALATAAAAAARMAGRWYMRRYGLAGHARGQ
ncbi:hypothetical protein Vafri_12743, partial [Volvox africanus]